jgi:hypothetical protein
MKIILNKVETCALRKFLNGTTPLQPHRLIITTIDCGMGDDITIELVDEQGVTITKENISDVDSW